MTPSILFLLTNYFNEKDTCSFIKHELLQQNYKNIETVIIDNGSNNSDSLRMLQSENSTIFLVTSPKNLGYLNGAAFGLKEYLKSNRKFPDAVIIANTDILLEKSNLMETISKKYLLTPNNIGIVGPCIFSTLTNYQQNPYLIQRIARKKLLFLEKVFSDYLLYLTYETISLFKRNLFSFFQNKVNAQECMTVYAIHGSFMILTKTFFEKGGNLNYGAFLFGEEIFLAEQAQKMNLKVVYDNTLKITHNEHATTRIFKSKKLVKHMHDSIRYLLTTFFI